MTEDIPPENHLNGSGRLAEIAKQASDARSRPLLGFFMEFKWLLSVGVPAAITAGYLALPASTAQVEHVKTEAENNLAVAKTELVGQLKVVDSRLDSVNARIDTMQGEVSDTRNDVKEILKRLPDPGRLETAAPIPSPAPAVMLERPPRKARKKPASTQAQPTGFSLFR